jgi:flagellar biosynthesis chaperone FliJ
MNNPRRKRLQKIYDTIESALAELEEIMDEEQDYLDNIPENLQGSERYEKSEEIIDNLEGAVSNLEDVMDSIEESIN